MGGLQANCESCYNVNKYPLSNTDDLYNKLSGGRYYSKLDLSYAYQQLCIHEASQLLTTINTSKGLFSYTKLCYGIASSPAIFQ